MSDIISVDSHISEFSDYLDNNCRCVLSARFGDGKSFFLNEVRQKLSDRYIFLTIYPVNYQVAENKDIFEYIKRDILLQILMSSEIVFSDDKYSFPLRLWAFLNNSKADLLSDIVKLLTSSFANIPSNAIKIFSRNIEKFQKFSTAINNSDSNKIEAYLAEFADQSGGIYEFDPISQIIYQLIADLKERSGKRIVLVIEDMDRIDPAHIFRILNVFSAHWDICDFSECKLAEGNPLNKYNLDKILLVCHFQNIRNIFHHFYGAKTDFTGYIHKYSSSGPYEYSLSDVMKEWVYNKIPFDHDMYPDICKQLASLIMCKHSNKEHIITNVRHITDIFNKEKYNIRTTYIQVGSSHYVNTYNQVSILLSILNDFEISVDDFLTSVLSTFNNVPAYESDSRHNQICNFIGACWLLFSFINNKIDFSYDSRGVKYDRYNLLSEISVLEDKGFLSKYLVKDIKFPEHLMDSQLKHIFYVKARYAQIFEYCQRLLY